MDVFNACKQIRMDAGPRGKKCPGGYSIPANKQCGGKGKGKGKLRSSGPRFSIGGAVAGGVLGVGLGAATAASAISRGEERKKGGGSETDRQAMMKKTYEAATGGGGTVPNIGSEVSQEAAEKGGRALDEWASANEPLKSNKSPRAGKEKGKGRKDSARRVFATAVQNGRG